MDFKTRFVGSNFTVFVCLQEILEMPVPTPVFWSTVRPKAWGPRPAPGSLIAECVPHLIQGRMHLIIIFTIHITNMVYGI